ncbi:alpha/beta fold hydrolase [Flavobacterium sp. W21_SRS_FM6]|uniref:alpha/beta fold hydrolase n=1 Tax=Flavobacterium sp. W21_SRS_FM6 TaxID=3240268 RepID=UPI003F8FBB42
MLAKVIIVLSKIHYQTYLCEKERPWVLLIHGLFGSLDNLSALRRGLNENYNILSVDLPDHGKSTRTNKFSFDLYATLIIELLAELTIQKVNIIGHSLGGKVSMNIALKRPELVQRLVIIDIAPVAYSRSHDSVFLGLDSIPLATMTNRNMADDFLKQHVHELSTRQFLLKSLYQDEDGWHWYFNLALLKRDYLDILAEIKADTVYNGPTLFIKGELSDYLLPAHRDKIVSLFPNSQSKLIGGTGHWLHAEKPAICLKTIELFFTKTASSTSGLNA